MLYSITFAREEYNMGWLVQAEAPPGPLFRTFREAGRRFRAYDYWQHAARLPFVRCFPLKGIDASGSPRKFGRFPPSSAQALHVCMYVLVIDLINTLTMYIYMHIYL